MAMAAPTPGAGSMNSGPSPGMQASRYYLVLTYPEGQYDGEYVEGKKATHPAPRPARHPRDAAAAHPRYRRTDMECSPTLTATATRVSGDVTNFGAQARSPGQTATATR